LVGRLVGELKPGWLVEPTKRPEVPPGVCLVGGHAQFQEPTKRPKVLSALLVGWRLEDAGEGAPTGHRGTAGDASQGAEELPGTPPGAYTNIHELENKDT
jgi:hypothetical protein